MIFFTLHRMVLLLETLKVNTLFLSQNLIKLKVSYLKPPTIKNNSCMPSMPMFSEALPFSWLPVCLSLSYFKDYNSTTRRAEVVNLIE